MKGLEFRAVAVMACDDEVIPLQERIETVGGDADLQEVCDTERLVPENLAEPLRWKSPKMVFVNSMSDLFHRDVPEENVVQVAQVMRTADWHTYQVLTKRAERLREMLQTTLAAIAAVEAMSRGAAAPQEPRLFDKN